VNRALRAATMGALFLSPIALTACSAGQVTQTASQDRDKVGPEAEVGAITLRQVTLEYPDEGRYENGDDAPLIMAIVNGGNEADTLTGIEGEGFDGALVSGQATASPAVPGSPSATPSASGATPSTTGTAPTTSATPTTASASSRVDIPVPPRSTVYVGGQDGLTVELADLSEELTAGQSLDLTLTFERAGEVTVAALVATPGEVLEREEAFDFHEEEGGAEEGAEDAAREREDESEG
jgi:copper(I)-binding protein